MIKSSGAQGQNFVALEEYLRSVQADLEARAKLANDELVKQEEQTCQEREQRKKKKQQHRANANQQSHQREAEADEKEIIRNTRINQSASPMIEGNTPSQDILADEK
jgi:hypothetical protein